ncbi:MAG TPA: SgcJ/EcaC family oxidoreductase [Terriglobales bacterium]|nr:SgcJ/EcaC family oxidoreductase [Terriglobales bacterium]
MVLNRCRFACFTFILLALLLLVTPLAAAAGSTEDANAAIERWSAAYSANDVDAVVKSYWPDAIVLGTKSPVISTGADAIRKYFTDLKLQGSGNKNAIQEKHSIPISDNAVLVTGFYEFTRMNEGKPVPGPSRFTMLVTKRGNEWRIAHHHSSPRVMPSP